MSFPGAYVAPAPMTSREPNLTSASPDATGTCVAPSNPPPTSTADACALPQQPR